MLPIEQRRWVSVKFIIPGQPGRISSRVENASASIDADFVPSTRLANSGPTSLSATIVAVLTGPTSDSTASAGNRRSAPAPSFAMTATARPFSISILVARHPVRTSPPRFVISAATALAISTFPRGANPNVLYPPVFRGTDQPTCTDPVTGQL